MFYYQFNQVLAIKSEEIQQNTVKSTDPFFTCLDLILKITQKVGKSHGFSLLQRLSGIKMNKLRAKLEG